MIKCENCSKQLQGEVRNLKFCVDCHKHSCMSCLIKGRCPDCIIINEQKNLVDEYFEEKYGVIENANT